MVAVNASNHFTLAGYEIHWCIPVIHVTSLSTADSDAILNRTTGELPSAIFIMVVVIALHSFDVVVCWALEVHWKIPLIDIACIRALRQGSTADNIDTLLS